LVTDQVQEVDLVGIDLKDLLKEGLVEKAKEGINLFFILFICFMFILNEFQNKILFLTCCQNEILNFVSNLLKSENAFWRSYERIKLDRNLVLNYNLL